MKAPDHVHPLATLMPYEGGLAVLHIAYPANEDFMDRDALEYAQHYAGDIGATVLDTTEGLFAHDLTEDGGRTGGWLVLLRLDNCAYCDHPRNEHQTGEGPWTGFCGHIDCDCEAVR